MIVYSTSENEGYLSKQGIEKLRSALANDIFMQDMYCTYEKQTEYRDRLRADGKKSIADIIEKINNKQTVNLQIQAMLLQLADKLSRTKGKKVYGYLKPEVKAIVDAIMVRLSENEQITKLYDLWYQQKEEALKVYTDEMPQRIPLADNREFKPLKNVIIQEALKISRYIYRDETADTDDERQELNQESDEEIIFTVPPGEDHYMPISEDYEVPTEEKDNSDEEKSSDNTENNYYAAIGAMRLLRYLGRMLQNRIDENKIIADSRVDRKLYRKIQEKKQAQGLK